IRRMKVRIEPLHERVLRQQGVVDGSPDDRLEVDDLTGGKKILLIESQLSVRQDEVRAQRATTLQKLGQQDDHDRHAPDVLTAGHDKQIQIAAAFEVQVRDAARQ